MLTNARKRYQKQRISLENNMWQRVSTLMTAMTKTSILLFSPIGQMPRHAAAIVAMKEVCQYPHHLGTIDNRSTMDVIWNPHLVWNICKANCKMNIHCTPGMTSNNLVADLPGCGTVWFTPRELHFLSLFASKRKMQGHIQQHKFKCIPNASSRWDDVAIWRIRKQIVLLKCSNWWEWNHPGEHCGIKPIQLFRWCLLTSNCCLTDTMHNWANQGFHPIHQWWAPSWLPYQLTWQAAEHIFGPDIGMLKGNHQANPQGNHATVGSPARHNDVAPRCDNLGDIM